MAAIWKINTKTVSQNYKFATEMETEQMLYAVALSIFWKAFNTKLKIDIVKFLNRSCKILIIFLLIMATCSSNSQ